MTDLSTPIFVISFNRAKYLERVIASYRRLSRPVDIVIHDNGSSEPETLAALDAFERAGVTVVRRPAIAEADELNGLDDTVQSYFRSHPWVPYVVTDCDVDLTTASSKTLDVFHELLARFPAAQCVGPMLRIADVRQSHPLFNRLMNRHVSQFWGREPEWTATSFGRVAYINARIDTTFALHRPGEPFRRRKPGLRVYHPYEAEHLDWYLAETSRDAYFYSSSPLISHWNNRAAQERHGAEALAVDRYFVVAGGENGELMTRTVRPHLDNPL